jgi:hypothetical protein
MTMVGMHALTDMRGGLCTTLETLNSTFAAEVVSACGLHPLALMGSRSKYEIVLVSCCIARQVLRREIGYSRLPVERFKVISSPGSAYRPR